MRELTFTVLLRYARICKRDGYDKEDRKHLMWAYQQGWEDAGGY